MEKVSIIVACRNEEQFIGKCLASLLDQDYEGEIEIIVVDRMSTDQTWGVVNTYREMYPNINLEVNLKKAKYAGLNQVIPNTNGDYIAIADAHAVYPKDYISKFVDWLRTGFADNVGGIQVHVERTKNWLSKAIITALTKPFLHD